MRLGLLALMSALAAFFASSSSAVAAQAASDPTRVVVMAQSSVDPNVAAPSAIASPAEKKSDHFETYMAWGAGIVALIVVLVGGSWFSRLSARDRRRPDATPPDA